MGEIGGCLQSRRAMRVSGISECGYDIEEIDGGGAAEPT
jgi:hypothetical protein